MIVSNITQAQLESALITTNDYHGYQLIFRDGLKALNQKRTRWQFTIRSAASKIRGSRQSWTGRNIPAASWHAYGHFINTILDSVPAAVVRSAHARYDAHNREWRDWQTGSQMAPCMMSSLSIL